MGMLQVGNAGAFTQADWASDIKLAAAVGIDGFALNFAGDSYTSTQLDYAYAAAEAYNSGKPASPFTLFLSLDYAANNGNPSFPQFTQAAVINWINAYSGKSAQFKVDGKPFVSTFEGVGNAGDWPTIKAQTGCYFVPVWTSAKGTPSTFNVVDGALGWDVWPYGPTGISTSIDDGWKGILGSTKTYMMGVAPWFYTKLADKNWLWRGDNLWHDRWQQVVEIQPEFVEVNHPFPGSLPSLLTLQILTWNDFGESHYIGPLHTSSFPAGSAEYVSEMTHDGWRDLLPYYIDAYKNGNSTSRPVTEEKIIYAHRPNPSGSGSTGGTTGNAPFQKDSYPPGDCSLDAINLDVIVSEPSDVFVQIGSNTPTQLRATVAGPNHFLVYFNGQTGTVKYTVSRNGATVMSVTGAAITSPTDGLVNWNAIVGTS